LICESVDSAHFLDARDHSTGQVFALLRCAKCGFVFTWPQPANLNEYYPTYYRQYHPVVLRFLKLMQEAKTLGSGRKLDPPGHALEIGCGEGWVLAALKKRGWRVTGLERTAASARFAAQELGVPMVVGGLEVLSSAAQFDLIILHQVLEHLPQPMQTLQACARLLRPGGRMIIEVPNLGSWQFWYAGRHWVHLDVPRHLGHFTPQSIRRALRRAGLEVQGYSFVSLEYDPFGWVQAVLNQLGFPQNLLLRWLAGSWRDSLFTGKGLVMALIAAVLAPPSFLLSIISWVAKAGAIMEVRAVRPA
jgi:SAM-dependent methyltransferase